MSKRVVVIDYGMGNLLSVVRAFEHCGAEVILSSEQAIVESADFLILPGVGAFADGMKGLRERNLIKSIKLFCTKERPFLGICLGMQMMMDVSEEFGVHEGLGLCHGRVLKIPTKSTDGSTHKVPNIGWYPLRKPDKTNWENTLLSDFEGKQPEVYVVHSYRVSPKYAKDCIAYYEYGGQKITAMIAKGYLVGCQFHPEKSGEVGLAMIRRFLEM